MMRTIIGVTGAAAVAFGLLFAPSAARAEVAPVSMMLSGAATSASDPSPVQLDADVYVPEVTPAPAVLLAHGFGGSKEGVAEEAQMLADAGYVVLAYTARGFGESTGQISMNAPDFEVADASALIDYLASLASVSMEAPGDPVRGHHLERPGDFALRAERC